MTQALYQEQAYQDVALQGRPHSLFPSPALRHFHQQRPSSQQATVGRYTMEQASSQQQRKSVLDAHAQLWQTNGLPRELNLHAATPATGGFFPGTSTADSMARYSAMLMGSVNAQAFNHNHGLPMAAPLIMSEDYQGVLNNHFHYAGTLAGRPTMVKSEADYTDSPLWPLPMRQPALMQHVGTADGSDIDASTASLSPRSTYFSEPSERGTVYSPGQGRGEASASSTWVEQPFSSPTQIKQSPSQSSSPSFRTQLTYAYGGGMRSGVPSSQPATVGNVPSVEQYEAALCSQVDHFSMPWPASVGQIDGIGALAWQPSMYSQAQPSTQSPYYSTGFVDPFQQSAHSSGSNASGAIAQDHSPPRELQRRAHRQDAHDVAKPSDERAQRGIENRILIDGKAARLTYKEIRTRIIARFGGEVAESTLRGRYRAMTKQKKDRVRKPTWTAKDIRLLREVVNQQLNTIGDGHRTIDPSQRLNKVSWKKVGEYILEHGGSYRFGNSTCKKKWIEVNQRR